MGGMGRGGKKGRKEGRQGREKEEIGTRQNSDGFPLLDSLPAVSQVTKGKHRLLLSPGRGGAHILYPVQSSSDFPALRAVLCPLPGFLLGVLGPQYRRGL